MADKSGHLNIDHLVPLCLLHSIDLPGVKPKALPAPLGNCLVYSPSSETPDELLSIDVSNILSLQSLLSTAKHDSRITDLIQKLENEGWLQNNERRALMLNLALAFRGVEVGGVWTSYVRFLPEKVPLPTTWNETQLKNLRGTSLEYAVGAKLFALDKEFSELSEYVKEHPLFLDNEDTSRNPAGKEHALKSREINFREWVHLDALVRSRSLEIPGLGTCLVPVIDLANHSSNANARYSYEGNEGSRITLVPTGDEPLIKGEEVRINYGSHKSPAEFLFSYGFLESGVDTKSITLPLELPGDDPYSKAKQMILKAPPMFTVSKEPTRYKFNWTGDGVWLLTVSPHSDDPLEFRLVQSNSGGRSLEASFEGKVFESASELKTILEKSELWPVYQLRALVLILGKLDEVIDKMVVAEMERSQDQDDPDELVSLARELRMKEGEFISAAVASLGKERDELAKNTVVQEYLAKMQREAEETQTKPEEDGEDDAEDFT